MCCRVNPMDESPRSEVGGAVVPQWKAGRGRPRRTRSGGLPRRSGHSLPVFRSFVVVGGRGGEVFAPPPPSSKGEKIHSRRPTPPLSSTAAPFKAFPPPSLRRWHDPTVLADAAVGTYISGVEFICLLLVIYVNENNCATERILSSLGYTNGQIVT